MSRLTEKSTNYDFYFPKKKVSILDLSDKLGQLEDIEEELGCPLVVVFEALKEGIVLNNKKLYSCKLSSHKKYGWGFICYTNNEAQVGVSVKQYKKTWWLPSDKEWKDE